MTVYAQLKDKKHGNSVIWFFPTHYDHKSTLARKNAADLMVRQMKEICNVGNLKEAGPVIFHVGDLNTTYVDDMLLGLRDNMYYARLEADGPVFSTGTYNGFKGSSSLIDHIFYGGKSVKPVKYWVDKTDYGVPFISDHYPVLFQWEYK